MKEEIKNEIKDLLGQIFDYVKAVGNDEGFKAARDFSFEQATKHFQDGDDTKAQSFRDLSKELDKEHLRRKDFKAWGYATDDRDRILELLDS